MATNFYFNNFGSSGEQSLFEDLIIESIRIYGQDMYYIPRTVTNYDSLYGADDQSQYNSAYLVELYIKSVDGFTGDGTFMSKFGIEIRDQVIFSIAKKTYEKEVGTYTSATRPNEGDLIYFPLNKKCFQIKFVNKFEMFYQFGALQTYELTCELFEYSNEKINTGIAEIDILQTKFSTDILDYTLLDEFGKPLSDENSDFLVTEQYVLEDISLNADNEILVNGSDNFPDGSNDFIDFSEVNPFSEDSV